jgi:branched-chain amino acid transport system permease protein
MTKRFSPHSGSMVARPLLPLGVLALVLIPLPWLLSSYAVSVLIFIGIYTIVVIGLSLLAGFAGQISLGHAAFYGIGAYTSGILATRLAVSPWIGLVAAGALSGLVAWAIGAVILQLRGHYLTIATLGFGIIVNIVMLEWVAITGGPSGFSKVPTFVLPGYELQSDRDYYYLVLAALFIAIITALNLVRSRVGRALRALHESEIGAETLGVNTTSFKLRVFVLSAVFAGCAGSLYAHYVGFVNPSPFGFKFSVELLMMAAIGGLASVWGALFGAALIVFLSETIREVLPLILADASGEQQIILFGLILIGVMIFMPDGVIGSLGNWLARRIQGRRLAESLAHESPAVTTVPSQPPQTRSSVLDSNE